MKGIRYFFIFLLITILLEAVKGGEGGDPDEQTETPTKKGDINNILKQLNDEFVCLHYKTFIEAKQEENSDGHKIDYECSEEKQTVVTIKMNAKNMFEIKFYEAEAIEPKEKNEKITMSMVCFELISNFSVNTYNYFQCDPVTLNLKDKDIIKKKTFNGIFEEINKMISHVKSHDSINFEMVLEHLKSKKTNDSGDEGQTEEQQNDGSHTDGVAEKRFEIKVNEQIEIPEIEKFEEVFTLKENVKNHLEHYPELKGVEGISFNFQFDSHPLVIFKGVIYYSSEEYIRLIFFSHNQEYDIFIKRNSGELKDYDEDIKKLLKEILGKETTANKYKGTNVMNLALAAVSLNETIKNHHKDQQYILIDCPKPDDEEKGEEEEGDMMSEKITYENMDTTKWFYHENDNLDTFGKLFDDQQITPKNVDRYPGNTKTADEIEKEQLNEIIKNYLINQKNYGKFCYGNKILNRKLIVQFFAYDDEFYKSIQVKFITQFFVSEFIIPYSEYNTFEENVQDIMSEVHGHYTSIILGTNHVDKQVEIKIDQVEKVILDQLQKLNFIKDENPSGFCIKKNQNQDQDQDKNKNENNFKILMNPSFKDIDITEIKRACDNTNQDARKEIEESKQKNESETDSAKITECQDSDVNAKKRKTFLNIERIDDGKNKSYNLSINEPNSRSKKSITSKYQFYTSYPYDYIPVLVNYVRSTLCRVVQDKYKRVEIPDAEITSIFTKQPQQTGRLLLLD
jgi:hypothetical protein